MERWQLSQKELTRYGIIENTIEGYLNAAEAREQLHLSRRQVFRLKRKLREKGIEGISSLEEANEYLHSVFLPKHNKKFTRKPKVEESAYRMIVKGKDLDQIFSIKEERPVQGDNTISYKGKLYQILPTETRFGFAKARVEVQKHLDKTIHIFYKGEELPFKPIIPQKDERYALSQIDALAVGVRHFHLAERVI